jgi:two-component system OmpR family sensor kinase/two-component system sensor histidine kinase BaeS
MTHSNSVRSIRNRLFLLLLRAFIIVVAFLILFTLLATALVLAYPSQSNPLYRLPTIARLETYYIASGSWDGVSTVFSNSLDIESSQWNSSILLDAQNRIVVKHGQPVDPSKSSTYQPTSGEEVIPILVNNEVVGKLVVGENTLPSERRFTLRFLLPVVLVSLILAVFATLIGLLLTRRVVTPLAEVIAASEEIAGGHLQTRVHVQGPDDLRDMSDSFNKMADALERNDRERREMLADIAHELRTPLTVLRGRLEGIMDGVYQADESNIGPALEETYLLERLVEDLSLLALAETRQLHFELKPVQARELVERVMGLFAAQAAEQHISLSLQAEPDLPAVLVDPQRLEQVVGNLLDNALRYLPDDSHLGISIHLSGQEVEITVADNGPGVAEDELPLIFNRFWRSDKSRTRLTGGAGLGLAIARQLIEAQGGTIVATNRPEGGLQIRLRLPAAPGS